MKDGKGAEEGGGRELWPRPHELSQEGSEPASPSQVWSPSWLAQLRGVTLNWLPRGWEGGTSIVASARLLH